MYYIDIDECEDNPDICGENSSCENEIGSFICVCDSGYSMSDNGVCINVNECTAKIALCSVMATCQDTSGSYQCTCQEGFTGDGRNCAVNGKSVSLYKTLNVPMFEHWLLSFNELLAVKQVLSWKNASRCVDSVLIAKSISSISGAWFHNNLVL